MNAIAVNNSNLVVLANSRIIDNMRFSSAFAVLVVVLGTGVVIGQTAASPAVAGKAQTDYRLDDGIGGVALYPGAGYRSFVDAKFLVSSLQDLESRVSQLPRGTTLHWLPHKWDMFPPGSPGLFAGGQYGLFASGQYEQFSRFCSDHGIQLLIERTYRAHVDADGSYARTVLAQTDKGKTPLEFHSVPVHLAPNAGGSKDFILRMLYDRETKLFYWQSYGLYPGYGPEGDANLSDQWLASTIIYVASDQMAIFRIAIGGFLGVSVSTKRENSLSQGQASAIRALERKKATPFRGYNLAAYLKQLPPDFFKQCITDVYMPSMRSVERQPIKLGNLIWQVTVAAQNGNTATLSLDDAYNLISTKITLNPNADRDGNCKR